LQRRVAVFLRAVALLRSSSVVLVLHDTPESWKTLTTDWKPAKAGTL
jgi:hypothetical protein